MRQALAGHDGVEQGTQGDAFFATFTSPRRCVAAAIDIQRSLSSHEWPQSERVLVRMGIHSGEASEASTGLVGFQIHRAARVAAVGHGGQILLSSAAAGLVEDSLPAEASLRDLGAHRLKDLGRPETIFQVVADGLAYDFPPLRSLDNPELPNNLPASLSSFVGRQAELTEVRRLVTESRLVTLTGAGGSGKTRLALQAAAELLDGNGEGVWLVELAPVNDPDLVALTMISALQLRQVSEMTDLDSLVRSLRDHNALIVLDNCEHVVDTVAKIADAIGRNCPRVSLLATSREPLGVDGERVYRVRSLSLPDEGAENLEGSDAVELFVARARAHDSTFEIDRTIAPLVSSLCRRLDGIPLAIELAASRLSSMSLQDLHDRLDQRFRLLTGGSRNALPRQQTLGATVAWSYDLLNEAEREMLRRLSVFVGGFDLRAAEAVAGDGLESFDVADLLSSLVNKSLIIAERTSSSLRYRLLETIRQYAADQLIQVGGEEATRHARALHAQHYLDFCLEAAPELKGPKQGDLFKRLDLELDNILATFTTLAAPPERTGDILALGVALTDFVLTRRNLVVPNYLRTALSSDAAAAETLRVRALLGLGRMTQLSGDGGRSHQAARDLADEALALAKEIDDPGLIVDATALLASTWSDLGRKDLGVELGRAALEQARRINDPRLIAVALGAVSWSTDPMSDAREEITEALAIFRALGDLSSIASMLVHLSISFSYSPDDVREVLACLEEAVAVFEEIGSIFGHMLLESHASLYSFFLGDFDAAVEHGRRSLRLSRRNGSMVELDYWTYFALALAATHLGDFHLGAVLLGVHEGIEERATEPILGIWTSVEIGALEEGRGLLRRALGDGEYALLIAYGKNLGLDHAYDVALGRTSATELHEGGWSDSRTLNRNTEPVGQRPEVPSRRSR